MRINTPDRRTAAAAVELAVLLPFIMYVAVISTDWARLLYYTITIEACARNGAMYASDQGVSSTSPYASLAAAALAEAPSLNATAIVTSTTTTDATNSKAVVVAVSVPFKTITSFPGVPSNQTLTRHVQMRVAPLATRSTP